MDFTFSEEQEAVVESAAAVFAGHSALARLSEIERGETRIDDALWAELARAHLLGLAVPEEHGGSGLGLTELCLVLEQQGRHVAPVPLWATTVLGGLPLARFGSPTQRASLLPALSAGELKMSAALNEVAASPARTPAVQASPDGEGWRLEGTAVAVPQAHVASRVLVPASCRTDGHLGARGPGAGTIVAVVDPAGPGASLERAVTTDRQVHPHLRLDGVPVEPSDVLAGPERGAEVVEQMVQWATTGLCAVQLGLAEEAVRRAAAYCNERRQFGRPLSSFQGTMLRAADAYIDTEAIRVTTWQAAWRLDSGRPAAEAVAVAKWWASEAGQRVVHATQHLHGGLGADVDYPIHRYFLWGKQIELMLEGPSAQLARLGEMIAGELQPAGSPAAMTGWTKATGGS